MLISDYRMLLSGEKMQYTNGNYAISRLIALGIMVDREAPMLVKQVLRCFVSCLKVTLIHLIDLIIKLRVWEKNL